MSEIDFLALIEQGSTSWNLWRAENPDIQPDLGQAYLFGQSLGEFDFSHTNLERACLIGANLRGTNLQGSCLRSAYASGTDFTGANLTNADLSRGNFSDAHFDEANLSTAQAIGTNFSNASLSGACIANWKINRTTVLNNLRASHIYLNPQQRQPAEGKFQPGELAALLQPSAAPFESAVHPRNQAKNRVKIKIQNKLKPALIVSLVLATGGITVTTLSTKFISATPSAAPPQEQTLPPPALTDEFVVLPCNEGQPPAQLIAALGYEYADGTRYYGNFTNGQPDDGRGTLIYPSKNRYDGEFKDGLRSGCGTFNFNNGRRYIGQFEADQFSGKGTWILENGERYIGEFKNNQCDGKGTFIFANGSSKSGIWKEGKLLDTSISCDQGSLSLPASPESKRS